MLRSVCIRGMPDCVTARMSSLVSDSVDVEERKAPPKQVPMVRRFSPESMSKVNVSSSTKLLVPPCSHSLSSAAEKAQWWVPGPLRMHGGSFCKLVPTHRAGCASLGTVGISHITTMVPNVATHQAQPGLPLGAARALCRGPQGPASTRHPSPAHAAHSDGSSGSCRQRSTSCCRGTGLSTDRAGWEPHHPSAAGTCIQQRELGTAGIVGEHATKLCELLSNQDNILDFIPIKPSCCFSLHLIFCFANVKFWKLKPVVQPQLG